MLSFKMLWLRCLFIGLSLHCVYGMTRNTTLKRLVDSCFTSSSNCCFQNSSYSWVQTKPRCEFDPVTESYPCSIKLGVNDWDNTFVNVYVAKLFLEEYLGYPVEIAADYDDFKAFGGEQGGVVPLADMWDYLEDGVVDAMLEVWAIGKEELINEYIVKRGTVVDAGPLGIVGAIGWFTPSSVLTTESYAPLNVYECNIAAFFEYWRSLQSPGVSDIFGDSKSERPCCATDVYASPLQEFPCIASEDLGGTTVADGGFATSGDCTVGVNYSTFGGRFLDGAASWTQYDDQIIKNLGLNFTVQYAGFESEIIRQARLAEQNNDPLLFYYWEPNALFVEMNLTRILLPKHSQACWDTRFDGGVDCDYPSEFLFKMFSTSFQEKFIDAAKFLETMKFASNRDQEEVLFDATIVKTSFHEAACNWALNPDNVATWQEWLDAVDFNFNNSVLATEVAEETKIVCDCKEGVRNVVVVLNATERDGVEISPDEDPCSLTGSSSYKSRWIEIEQATVLDQTILCSYAPYDASSSILSLAMSGVSIFILLIFLIVLTAVRNNKFVMASSYMTLATFLVGGILMNVYAVFNVGLPTSVSCGVRFAAIVYGFLFFQVSLVVKLVVLMRLFTPFRKSKRCTAKQLKLQALYCLLIGSLIVLLWGLLVGFDPIPSDTEEELGLDIDDNLICPTSDTFLAFLLLGVLVLVVLCVYLSYQTRYIHGAFSESRYNAVTSYNLVVIGVVGVALSTQVDTFTYEDQVLLVTIAIAWITLVSASLIVGTRIYAALSKQEFDAHRLLLESRPPSKRLTGLTGHTEEHGNVTVHRIGTLPKIGTNTNSASEPLTRKSGSTIESRVQSI